MKKIFFGSRECFGFSAFNKTTIFHFFAQTAKAEEEKIFGAVVDVDFGKKQPVVKIAFPMLCTRWKPSSASYCDFFLFRHALRGTFCAVMPSRRLIHCNQSEQHTRTTLFAIFSSRLINSSMSRKAELETLALFAFVGRVSSVCEHHAIDFWDFLTFSFRFPFSYFRSRVKTRKIRPILREAIRLGRVQLENYTNSQRIYLYRVGKRQKMFLN